MRKGCREDTTAEWLQSLIISTQYCMTECKLLRFVWQTVSGIVENALHGLIVQRRQHSIVGTSSTLDILQLWKVVRPWAAYQHELRNARRLLHALS